MKIAFTTKGSKWDSKMDPRLGRTEFILLYDEETDEFSSYDNRAIEQTAHGAGPLTVKRLFELAPDVLVTGNGPGGNAAAALKNAPIKIFIGAGDMTVREAYSTYKNGDLTLL